MSHGGGSDSTCDPNLTPLLDLVLQLLMFFIVCVNFVAEQVSGDVKLPYSDSAQPIEKSDLNALFINQKSLKSRDFRDKLTPEQLERFRNSDSVVMVPGKEPMSLLEARTWLRKNHEDAEKTAKLAGEKEVKTVIHFRPDENLELKELFMLMNHCKAAGYKKLKVRAIVRRSTG
jgi:biopolymer transport protein ExbD